MGLVKSGALERGSGAFNGALKQSTGAFEEKVRDTILLPGRF